MRHVRVSIENPVHRPVQHWLAKTHGVPLARHTGVTVAFIGSGLDGGSDGDNVGDMDGDVVISAERTVTVTIIPFSQCVPTSQAKTMSPISFSVKTYEAPDDVPTKMRCDMLQPPFG